MGKLKLENVRFHIWALCCFSFHLSLPKCKWMGGWMCGLKCLEFCAYLLCKHQRFRKSMVKKTQHKPYEYVQCAMAIDIEKQFKQKQRTQTINNIE